MDNYHFPCDCIGCKTGDLDDDQLAGGDFNKFVQEGNMKALEKMPAHNKFVLEQLQRSFDEAVRVHVPGC